MGVPTPIYLLTFRLIYRPLSWVCPHPHISCEHFNECICLYVVHVPMSILFVQSFRCNECICPYVACVPTSTPLMQLFRCNEYICPYVACVPTSTPLMQLFHCSEYICSYACVCQHQYLLHRRIRGIGKLSKQSSSYFLIFLSIPPYLFSLAVGCVCVCVSFYLPDRQ